MCRWLNSTLLYSYLSRRFADAFNTVAATANGAKGVVPSYRLMDLNTTFHLTNKYTFRLLDNNLINKSRFAKCPTFYLGLWIGPLDGRSIVATVGVNI